MRIFEIMKCRRPWKCYEPFARGSTQIADSDNVLADVRYDLGNVITGRTQVWTGYYARIVDPQGVEWIAEHPSGLAKAVRTLANDTLSPVGWTLFAAVVFDDLLYETGLSANSGFGYIRGQEHLGAVPIMEPFSFP